VLYDENMNRYLTPKQVAKLINKSEMTIYRWIKSGKLPAEKNEFPSGRHQYFISETDIPSFLKCQK